MNQSTTTTPAPWPGTFYPSSAADLDDAAYKAALDAIPDTDADAEAQVEREQLDSQIEAIMHTIQCGFGCVLPITDAAAIATELGFFNFPDLANYFGATGNIRDGKLHLTPA